MDTSGNQEPPKTQPLNGIEINPHIELTPPEDIPYIDLAINPNNEATTPEDTLNTLEPPKPIESPGTTGEIPVQSSTIT